ncbi:MAG: DUF3800 domain-containing protein [Phycisphaerales bacterium]|nr:DUF3800 domain-containing protein [Phycisphaerales bacterium]
MSRQEKEYILYCDESVGAGAYYSNFYGGALIGASQIESLSNRLNAAKRSLNLHQEVKWQKVTEPYLGKYTALMDAFFDEIERGTVKVRIMFRQNAQRAVGLSDAQVEQEYYILYYQFIKHGFGFESRPIPAAPTGLRVYFDQFPHTGEKVERFRGYILGLNQSKAFRTTRVFLRKDALTEVRSHEHVTLQCLDIVLGAMAFRLNDMHLARPDGAARRGKRTIAKERLYRHIHSRICRIRPNFNIGVTTGGDPASRWTQPYRHWKFVPRDHEFDRALTKR